MRRLCICLPVLVALCAVPTLAQSNNSSSWPGPYSIAMGFGSAQDSSNHQGIASAISADPFSSCVPSASDASVCQETPGMTRFIMGFDGDAMLNKRLGFGGELMFQPGKGTYGPLQYRQEFYDFNALAEPLGTKKRMTLRFEGGLGGAHTGFSFNQSSCIGIATCTNQEQSVGGANHFQEHASVGLQIYVTHNIFIRPQFDYRHVDGFTNQFGSDNVLQYSVWLGYNFGTF